MKVKSSITIPRDLAKLLSAEDNDFKTDENREESRAVARALLRLLMNLDS